MSQSTPKPSHPAKPNLHPVLGIAPEDVFESVFRIRIAMRDRVCGGIPKDSGVQVKWLETKGFSPQEAEDLVRARRLEMGITDDGAEEFVSQEAERTWSGFRSDDDGLYLEQRQFRAMLRESATELGIVKANRGFRQRFQHGLFITPFKIRLWRDGQAIREPDGNQLKVVHAWTPQGKIAAFSRFDFVAAPVEIEFEVVIVRGREVQEKHLKPMLLLAEEAGFGTNRSQGEGKFNVVAFEHIRGADLETRATIADVVVESAAKKRRVAGKK